MVKRAEKNRLLREIQGDARNGFFALEYRF